MKQCADGARVACPLFQAEDGGSRPTSALQLRVSSIPFLEAKVLNRLWHSRLPRLTSPMCRASFGAEFDGLWYAVAVWCRPIAPNVPQYEWLELQRLAISPDAPRNTASRMIAVMTRLIVKDFLDVTRLISYQDTAVHKGTIYKAAGWTPTHCGTGDTWDRPSRSRKAPQSDAPKQRWEKVIRGDGMPVGG